LEEKKGMGPVSAQEVFIELKRKGGGQNREGGTTARRPCSIHSFRKGGGKRNGDFRRRCQIRKVISERKIQNLNIQARLREREPRGAVYRGRRLFAVWTMRKWGKCAKNRGLRPRKTFPRDKKREYRLSGRLSKWIELGDVHDSSCAMQKEEKRLKRKKGGGKVGGFKGQRGERAAVESIFALDFGGS